MERYPDASKKTSHMTPMFDKITKNYDGFRKKCINLLLSSNYQQLHTELVAHTPSEIAAFFEKQGHIFLNQAIIARSIQPLNFIVQNIPMEAIRKSFNSDNLNFLKGFVYASKMLESGNENTADEQNLMIEKFNLLLKIEPTAVQEFMEQYASSRDNATTSAVVAYRAALLNLQQQSLSPGL